MADPGLSRIRLQAALETSFWIAAYRSEVAANLLDFFNPVVPAAVEREILARQRDQPRREYPYATLFRHLRPGMIDPPNPEPAPLPILGPGEAAAISIAREIGIPILVNEWRAVTYARRAGIVAITVPSFIVVLRAEEILSDRAARRKLELISAFTAPDFIRDAARFLDRLV